MEATAQLSARPLFLDWYRWLIVLVGAIALTYATAFLPLPKFDCQFLILPPTLILVTPPSSFQYRASTRTSPSRTLSSFSCCCSTEDSPGFWSRRWKVCSRVC